jgi:hypothetical protein
VTEAHPTGDVPRTQADAGRPRGAKLQLKRAGLVSLMTVLTMNVWTGSPLMALWVGSRVYTAGASTMAAFGTVFVTMLAISLVLVQLLSRLGTVYDSVTGRRPAARRHTPWLRSMRGDRPHEQGEEYRLTALEKILVVSVVLAVVAFEIWFFFYSGSPIDQRSGRGP